MPQMDADIFRPDFICAHLRNLRSSGREIQKFRRGLEPYLCSWYIGKDVAEQEENRLSVCAPSGFETCFIAGSGEHLRLAHRPQAIFLAAISS
jgi:hypothetical protein